ncbi:MAG: EamA family transporter [Anaerolineales bacterium]
MPEPSASRPEAMTVRNWSAFLLLGLIWGTSFLWIKIGVRELAPFTLVGFRLLFGLLTMSVVILLRRPPFPRDLRTWFFLCLMGLTNTALPFVLITWGEVSVDSAVASVLNSSMPLFTLVIAHFFLEDERMTAPRVFGLALGFVGILLLFSRDLGRHGFSEGILGQLAILAAALSYAISSVYARRTLKGVATMVQAFVPMLVADSMMWIGAFTLESPLHLPQATLTWVAVAWLGILGSALAYLLYYGLLHRVGSTRTSLVTYVFPVVGVTAGVLFLGEQLDWHLAAGALLVVLGIVIVNRRHGAERLGRE